MRPCARIVSSSSALGRFIEAPTPLLYREERLKKSYVTMIQIEGGVMPRVYRPLLALAVASAFAFQTPQSGNPAPVDRVADPFAIGWLVVDTNGDGIADFINGKIVVPADPAAAENAAAANLAARLGFGSTGLTPPVVVPADRDSGGGPRIFVGRAAGALKGVELAADEGGAFAVGDNLAMIGADDAGLLAAADAYSARAPYQWRVPGKKLSDIGANLAGITYVRGKAGVHRAFFRKGDQVTEAPASAIEPAPAQPAGGAGAGGAAAGGGGGAGVGAAAGG